VTRYAWSIDGANILSAKNVDAAKDALGRGWLCGIHYYFAGGRSGDPIAFADYLEYLAHISAARPGDLFVLWSIASLVESGEMLQTGWEGVREYLREPNSEILAAAAGLAVVPQAVLADREGSNWGGSSNFSS
jgi:hypothetical protein